MGIVRDRFKFHFRGSSSSSLPPPSPPQPPATPQSTSARSTDPPPEFLCPISGDLMADPVIIPSGETFERACIEACRDLSVSPPSLSLDLSSSSSSLLLIPNSALRAAILRWCDNAGVPRPIPLSSEIAGRLARRYLPSSNSKPRTNCSTELLNEISSPITSSSSSTATSDNSSSSSSSCEIIAHKTLKPEPPESPLPADPLEEKIMARLKHAQIHEQENALISLLEATRESSSRRVVLGSPRLLAALRGLLLSRSPAVKSRALAIIVNLSLEPANKIRIVRSGAVPAIVDALQSSSREHAAGALFSLALEEQNRTAIGVLGAVPPLLRLFCDSREGLRARLEAGMALHYLGLAEMNMTKITRIAGVVKGLMAVAKEEERELRRVAMRVMVGMVGSKEGKAAMLDGGAVEAAVAFLKKEEEEEKEMVLTMLYGMSMGGLRFRGIARRAAAEKILEKAAEGLEGEKKEMVRMTIRVIRGEEGERERDVASFWWAAEAAAEEEEEERSVASETMVTRRRKNRDPDGGSGSNSAGF